jgi:hypothetical protein
VEKEIPDDSEEAKMEREEIANVLGYELSKDVTVEKFEEMYPEVVRVFERKNELKFLGKEKLESDGPGLDSGNTS